MFDMVDKDHKKAILLHKRKVTYKNTEELIKV